MVIEYLFAFSNKINVILEQKSSDNEINRVHTWLKKYLNVFRTTGKLRFEISPFFKKIICIHFFHLSRNVSKYCFAQSGTSLNAMLFIPCVYCTVRVEPSRPSKHDVFRRPIKNHFFFVRWSRLHRSTVSLILPFLYRLSFKVKLISQWTGRSHISLHPERSHTHSVFLQYSPFCLASRQKQLIP